MDSEPNVRDKVEVVCGKKKYVGFLMQRPELEDGGYLTLKLESGYNIGLKKSDVSSITVLELFKPAAKNIKSPVSDSSGKPVVSILSTGGTIASKIDYHSGGVSASFTADDLLEAMPELGDIACVRAKSIMNVMSEDMNPKLWVKIGESVVSELNSGAEGVVVTHGTDTMHYSSAALSFMLEGLSKPVVFTGAQRSTDRGSADSFLNLLCSAYMAKSQFAGVFLVMHGGMSDNFCLAHWGTKVRKMHTTRRDAFQSINITPSAKIYSDGKIEGIRGDLPSRGDSKIVLKPVFEEKVVLVRVYPGMDPGIFDYYLDKGVKGIVIEGTALGHVPTKIAETSVIPKIERVISEGVLVGMTTQCIYGTVNPHVYTNLREVSSRGVIYLGDMTSETAYVKMMWVLGNSKNLTEAKNLMSSNLRGEYGSKSLIEEDFTLF
ncbi:MAG: Glu-tRNA(Gln) amidotransferase subunit GatD [Candidatus Altiarchaeota archaeon]|nr:Glu-tRNA(Gln) amidotransferase subunit GatD [Candidatus Altiarchaeota archaeon]